MTALADRRARLLAALYATFGEAAAWTSAASGAVTSLTVRRKGEDDQVGFGESAALVTKDMLRVRVADLAAPAEDDQVVVQLAAGGAETVRVLAPPRRVRNGLEWVCEVAAVRAF